MAKTEQTASSMWNAKYSEEEAKRRRQYDRTPGSDYTSNVNKQESNDGEK